MIAFCCLLVAAVGGIAEGASTGTIGGLLVKVNTTLQTGVSDGKKVVDNTLSFGNNTVSSVADLVSSGSDKISHLAISGLDVGGDLSEQGISINQDSVNEILNIANNIPIVGKIVSRPNHIVSKLVNITSDIGRGTTDVIVGAGQASSAIASAVTTAVSDKVKDEISAVTGKISSASDKALELVSHGISKGVQDTSSAIGKLGGLLDWFGNKIADSATLPGSSSATSASSST